MFDPWFPNRISKFLWTKFIFEKFSLVKVNFSNVIFFRNSNTYIYSLFQTDGKRRKLNKTRLWQTDGFQKGEPLGGGNPFDGVLLDGK